MQTLKVNLSTLLERFNEFEAVEEYGFKNKLTNSVVYLSPRDLKLMMLYIIMEYEGVSDSIQIVDDVVQEDSNDDQLINVSTLRSLVDSSGDLGVYFSANSSTVQERLHLMVLREIKWSGDVEQDYTAIADALAGRVSELYGSEVSITEKIPKFVYVGKIPDYSEYRKLNDLLGEYLHTAIIYYNLGEYSKIRMEIENENRRVQFNHLLQDFSTDKVYTFSSSDRFVGMFLLKSIVDGKATDTDIRFRPVQQKFLQVKELYEWLMSCEYEVFMFSADIVSSNLDMGFYTALILAQKNRGIRVLLRSSGRYDAFMAELLDLQYGDFYSRFRNILDLYKRNTIRVLVNNRGRSSIGVIRDVKLNLRFSGLPLQNVKELIKIDDVGKASIVIDSGSGKTSKLNILTNSEFNKYAAAGFKIQPMNVFQKLLEVFYGDNCPARVGTEFEEYIYTVCRLLDQLVNSYSGHIVARDLACFRVIDTQGKLGSRTYIGCASIDPEAICDVLTLSDEGSMSQNITYKGEMLDINVVDDLPVLKFKRTIDSNILIGFEEKMRSIYEKLDVPVPYGETPILSSKTAPFAGFSLFMAMVYGTSYSTPMELEQNIYSLIQNKEYVREQETAKVMSDEPLAPIYFGMALNRNYAAYKWITPYVLDATTSFGYRQVSGRDSPINIFGGLNLDENYNLWLYPQLFQRHRPTTMEGR